MNQAAICLGLLLALAGPLKAQLVINEIHHSPVPQQDRLEFVELYNRSASAVSLTGWRLFGGVDYVFTHGPSIPAGGYTVVAENPPVLARRYGLLNLVGPWTGRLSGEGDRLRLYDPDGVLVDNVAFERGFPWPTVGAGPSTSIELVNPDLDNSLGGNWRPSPTQSPNPASAGPTPGRRNRSFATNTPPAIRQVHHTPELPTSGEPVVIDLRATDPDGVAEVTLEYQVVEPGAYIQINDPAYTTNWTRVPMTSINQSDYQVVLPADLQRHRRLIRYRVTATDVLGIGVRAPLPDDSCPNFTYFVYDGVPAWTGAVRPGSATALGQPFTVPAAEMNRLPTFHLIAREDQVLTATGWKPPAPLNQYRGDDYLWTGALVYYGEVYDHIRFRMRGGVWRYSMGKNAWKFDFNRGHELRMRDNYGRRLNTTWGKLSFRPDIQQGDYEHRGEQGLFESVGFRLFELAGTDANKAIHVQFRIIDRPEEASANQFQGDFWGKYLAVEEQDGRWLKERGLPDGNIYDMEGGFGAPNHLGRDGPTDSSDLRTFINTYTGAGSAALTESWWRTNLNLPSYFGYQIILQGIHHYDIQDGKNYFYYRNGANGQWNVQPWDLDLTWADTMYRGGKQSGDEPFFAPVLGRFNWTANRLPNLRREFRNRVREVRDLLFNPEQAGQVIDEQALLIRGTNNVSFVDADRAQWDYNPVMINGSITLASKAGQGRFYQKGVGSKTFAGMAQLMKNYVRYRATDPGYSLDTIAREADIPITPALSYDGAAGFPADQLRFASSKFSGKGLLGSVQYRVAEITRTNHPGFEAGRPWRYEIEPVWESPRLDRPTRSIAIPTGRLQAGRLYRARVRHWDSEGRASHWSEPVEFTAGPADYGAALLAHLELSELQYDPAQGGYEYLELHNRSRTETLVLDGATFTAGIGYTFAAGTPLPPDGYVVVARSSDLGGLRGFHHLPNETQIVGPYSGALANDADTVTLVTLATPGAGAQVFSVSYRSTPPWPIQAGGTGRSIVPRPGAPSNSARGDDWQASANRFGSPGRAEPGVPLPVGLFDPQVTGGQLQLRLLHAPGTATRVEASSDLQTWRVIATNPPPGRLKVELDEAGQYFRAVAE